ncbi:hypothetical protein [Microbacterium sp. SA39]|uniref:hypothetical protein n=1 Tax=Microbacterium sp. SA39 TaxID=1263625 RepID=UPI0005FA5456|nr:hypothetical protein [Microbacterium sp. SA39]KJQ52454.1 hypothetical protein RS85_03344 [Microbacterium sp. SA39]
MTARSNRKGGGAATAALFVTILLVSIGLALWTDWHIVLRGLAALGAGLVAAVVTSIVSRCIES